MCFLSLTVNSNQISDQHYTVYSIFCFHTSMMEISRFYGHLQKKPTWIRILYIMYFNFFYEIISGINHTCLSCITSENALISNLIELWFPCHQVIEVGKYFCDFRSVGEIFAFMIHSIKMCRDNSSENAPWSTILN